MSTEKPSIDNETKSKLSTNEGKKPDSGEKSEKEIGGFENRAEPTRYGDWDVNGRCSDF